VTLTIGSLCSGYGGLTLAVQRAVGGRVAWHSDIEPAASKVLEARFPGVPNIGDMTAIDWSNVEPVDVYEGGTPCQDVSHAGKMAGMRAGTRSGLWASFVDGIEALRPKLVVWENVRGVLSAEADSDLEPCPVCVGNGTGDGLRALGRVLGDLADVGYDARWCGLRASDVGAPHPRFRIFVIAQDTDQPASDQWRVAASGQAEGWGARADVGGRGRAPVADAERGGRDGRSDLTLGIPTRRTPARGHRENSAADTDRYGFGSVGRQHALGRDTDGRRSPDIAWGAYEPAIRRWEELTRPAPAPTVPGRSGGVLAPVFVEWLMGLPAGWVTDVPGLTRPDQLKMLGNGVVPQQAAAAITHLLEGE